jgi:acetolactate synthase-1/2/3 large subunit
VLPDVGEIISALRSAERPLLLLGPELNATRAGLAAGRRGVPAIPMESPRGANDPALGAFARAWPKADLVIVLGKPVDFSLRFGAQEAWPEARWLTVHGDEAEVRRAELNLGSRLISARHGPPRRFAEALIARAEELGSRDAWCTEVRAFCAQRPEVRLPASRIDSATLCRAVNALVAPDGPQIFVMDGGEFGQWAQALIRPSRRIVNGVSGAIGGGIGYAIGAKAAAPDMEVITLMGDGTAGFHLPEFETAVREDLPFIAVIGNDRRWNAEHELQRRTFGEDRVHGCTLSAARYDKAVEAMGGFGAYVTQQDALADALADARASGRPACVNVEIEGLAAPVFT